MARFLIYFFFTLSGSVALIYESLWSRYLKLFLGHSSDGQIVTLIMFMGGIGLGSFLAARYLRKVKNPFLAYARIEVVAAIFGFGFHAAYELMTGWFFEQAAMLQGASPMLADIVQIGICLLLTLPFATLLGTTFPLLAAGMIRGFPDGGKRSLPMLYFANSLGGAAGILCCSYYLISAFGTIGALQIASLGNLVVAIGFFGLHRAGVESSFAVSSEAKTKEPSTPSSGLSPKSPPRVALWLMVAAGTGLASFIYEVGWIRLLSLILGSSTHSFDAMISAFILGLAFGGLFVRRILNRFNGDLAPVLGTLQVLMGVFAALSLYLYRPFFDMVQASHSLFAKTEAAFPLHAVFKYLLCLALMFPAAFCAGMTLPLITWRLVRETGRETFTGLVYGWNTIGSILGAAVAGLVLMPLLQLKWTIFTGAALDIALGIALLTVGTSSWRARSRVARSVWGMNGLRVGACALMAAALLPAFFTDFDPSVLCSGKYRRATASSSDIVEVRHGKTATISVGQSGPNRFIATNGKSDGAIWMGEEGSFSWEKLSDEGTVAMLAALPMLTRDAEYDAALIGMGTGMTGHYLLSDSRLRSLDLIEIEDAVIDLAQHFRPRNERLWNDDRLSIVVDDAKRHFYANRKQYDVIISEPSNPWVSGVSGLFTKEFYEHLRHFLKPGGVLVQWVHGYEFRDDLMISIFSALDTFENFEVYRVPENDGDFIVVAGDGDFNFIDAMELAAKSELDDDLAYLGREIELFGPGNFLVSCKTLRPNLDEFRALTNSDYFPYVEQHAETAFFTSNRVQLPSALQDAFHGYTDIMEPGRARQAREMRVALERARADVGRQEEPSQTEKRLDGLLADPNKSADWVHIEQLLLTATVHSRGTEWWLEEWHVEKLREAIDRGVVPDEMVKRFHLLEHLAVGNLDQAAAILSDAVNQASPKILQEPYWVRTFLSVALRSGDRETIQFLMQESVGKCGRLSPDERIMIQGFVRQEITKEPQGLVAQP